MADVQIHYSETGANLYMLVERVSDNKVRDVVAGAWDTFAVADLGDYDTAGAETPAASYRYLFTFPALAAGDYIVKIFRRAGGAPAIADLLVGDGLVHWDGSAVMQLGTVDSTGQGMSMAKALEVAVAILAGKASYVSATGVWTVKGRDGTTTIYEGTLASQGGRTASTIS
ncbi:hypothetical protein LCGC14_1843240 [marine sediment metagenome]|uniref:Uncharacterized protein n=1 Tax=marine sediment metagenome TaxID=412755 RepID=A0A0F9JBU9_9ZZZZ